MARQGITGPEGIDPSINWNLGAGRADFFGRAGEQAPIPVLLALKGISAQDFAAGTTIFKGDNPETIKKKIAEWQASIFVSPLYTELLPQAGKLPEIQHITALVRESFFQQLRDAESTRVGEFVVSVALSPPLPRTSLPRRAALDVKPLPKFGKLPPKGVIVGIVDDGIAFAHERFRDTDGGTRVEFFWMQDGQGPGLPDLGFPGLEIRKPDFAGVKGIDSLLADCTHSGLVDEDELYRRASVADFGAPGHKPVAWRLAHGTHVLDLACGADRQSQPTRRIIAVQLPVAATGLPTTPSLASYLIQGIYYILVRSLLVSVRLGCGPLPVVINISYGLTAGPHDGTHPVEAAIDSLVDLWRSLYRVEVDVVIASGNSHLGRQHAAVTFDDQPVRCVPWRILPDSQSASVIEVWLPPGPPPPPSRISLSVAAPGSFGATTALDETPGGQQQLKVNGDVVCQVDYIYSTANGRGMFLINVQPTATRIDFSPSGPVAPSGLWTITLKNTRLTAADVVHLWSERSEAPYGYPVRGRQAYFDDRAYRRYDKAGRDIEVDLGNSIVKRKGSINSLATGVKPAVIGGVMRKELKLAKYSAGGRPPAVVSPVPRTSPDAATVSDDSYVHGGVLGAGTRSGSVIALNGTSVAAPRVVRELAGLLEAGKPGGRDAVQAMAETPPTALPGPSLDPDRAGAGGIDLPPIHPRRGIER